jgi:DNA-binding PadR family transcriptional regulator
MARSLGVTSLRILAAIRDGATYALDIVATTGLTSGTVYPTLARLKSGRLVQAKWEDQRVADREGRPRRRYYSLTRDGATTLAQGADMVRRVASDLAPHVREA